MKSCTVFILFALLIGLSACGNSADMTEYPEPADEVYEQVQPHVPEERTELQPDIEPAPELPDQPEPTERRPQG